MKSGAIPSLSGKEEELSPDNQNPYFEQEKYKMGLDFLFWDNSKSINTPNEIIKENNSHLKSFCSSETQIFQVLQGRNICFSPFQFKH